MAQADGQGPTYVVSPPTCGRHRGGHVVGCPDCALALPRPIEGCEFIDADDGTCGHPDAYSPECWKDGDDMSDCPMIGELHA